MEEPPARTSVDSVVLTEEELVRRAKRDHPPTSVSTANIDKGSRLADSTPNIKFMSPKEHDFPIIVYRCYNPVKTIMVSLVVEYCKGGHTVRKVLTPAGGDYQDLVAVAV